MRVGSRQRTLPLNLNWRALLRACWVIKISPLRPWALAAAERRVPERTLFFLMQTWQNFPAFPCRGVYYRPKMKALWCCMRLKMINGPICRCSSCCTSSVFILLFLHVCFPLRWVCEFVQMTLTWLLFEPLVPFPELRSVLYNAFF